MKRKGTIITIISLFSVLMLFGCENVQLTGTEHSSGIANNPHGDTGPLVSRPMDTLYAGDWRAVGAAFLHDAVSDDGSVNDGDYIEASGTDTAAEMILDDGVLTALQEASLNSRRDGNGNDSVQALIRFRASGDRPGNGRPEAVIRVQVYHGDTLVASSGPKSISDDGEFQDYSFSLTIWEVDPNSEARALRTRVLISGLKENKGDLARVSMLELEVPTNPGQGHFPPATEDPLLIKNTVRQPSRLGLGPDDKIYVSDSVVESVFIFDAELTRMVGELKGFSKPLGVAVDDSGRIFVGNDGRDNVEVFSPEGYMVGIIGQGKIRMPNDLVLDRNNNLYVVDSVMNLVWVFDPAGTLIRKIGSAGEGDGELKFPVALTILENDQGQDELFVADRGHRKIQSFTLEGEYIQSYGIELSDNTTKAVREAREFKLDLSNGGGQSKRMDMCKYAPLKPYYNCAARCEVNPTLSYCSTICADDPNHSFCDGYEPPPPPPEPIRFTKIQSLAVDSTGKIHALDIMAHWIQIFDPTDNSGLTSGSYGVRGKNIGQLMVPKDIVINSNGQVIVANSGNIRIEVIHIVTP